MLTQLSNVVLCRSLLTEGLQFSDVFVVHAARLLMVLLPLLRFKNHYLQASRRSVSAAGTRGVTKNAHTKTNSTRWSSIRLKASCIHEQGGAEGFSAGIRYSEAAAGQ